MATYANKNPKNVPGPFYCDDQCINCGLCRDTAPNHFALDETIDKSYVAKQPSAPDEVSLCKEAEGNCPASAIGSDGK